MDYKKNAVGLAGIAAGIIAICTAVWPAWIGEVRQSDGRTMYKLLLRKKKHFGNLFFPRPDLKRMSNPFLNQPQSIGRKYSR